MERTVPQPRQMPMQTVVPVFLAALNIVLGIWLLLSPYIVRYTVWSGARIIDDIFGPLILGMAITRLAMWAPRYWWLSFGNIILGLWVAISPFLFGYTPSLRATINNILVGLLVALFSAAGLLGQRSSTPARPAPARRR